MGDQAGASWGRQDGRGCGRMCREFQPDLHRCALSLSTLGVRRPHCCGPGVWRPLEATEALPYFTREVGLMQGHSRRLILAVESQL